MTQPCVDFDLWTSKAALCIVLGKEIETIDRRIKEKGVMKKGGMGEEKIWG